VGEGDDPRLEAVNFRARISFAVNAADLQKIDAGSPPKLTVTFLGVAGIQGPLPQVFTEMLVDRIKSRDTAGRDFLDIFNHRVTTLWYKLYTKLYPGLTDAKMESTQIGECMLDLGGAKSYKNGAELLPFGTLLWQRSASGRGLEELIKGYFNIPCRIRPFEGGWNRIDPEFKTTLGKKYSILGYDMVLGGRCYDQAQGFRIIIGPLPYESFKDFLPSDDPLSGYAHLKHVVSSYFESPPLFKIEVLLNQNEVPAASLNKGHALGYNTWLNIRKNYPYDGRAVVC
jgi:type VI secretion system protein ImpH